MNENYIKCSGCGEIIPVPGELYPGPIEGEISLQEPYYCDACERIAETAAEIGTPEVCSHCGKEIEDFSDLGCEYCDRRHPYYGCLE